jgi:hypothetical protein
MFKKLEDCTLEKINAHDSVDGDNNFIYECWVPPFGYGLNSSTGQLEKTDVIKRDTRKSEQYWQRTELPKDWIKLRREEERRQKLDPDYFNSDLERFRQQEWKRRLCGVWFYNNGTPTYITGLHYFYLNWWKIDIGYPGYRSSDRKLFYVLDYCLEDTRCGGLLEATKRRQGKTYRGGCFLYEGISRMSEVEGGIQSKTATDAKMVVFQKAVVSPFKKLPDFFRPIFDTSKGVTPTSELRFAHTTVKGKKALDNLDKPELNSLIDWASSDVFGYDGRKKKRIFEDEVGKTVECDVYDRHQVVRYCLETDGEWTGFAYKSTTVEEMESGGAAFKMLWDESDPKKRDDNGHTPTGMYRYMTPAYETLYFDKYGEPDVEKGKVYFLNRRKGLEHNPRALSGEIRKNPFNAKEMFRIDGDKCLYDSEKINNRRDELSWLENVIERGNLEWIDRDDWSKGVEWVKKSNGRWKICTGFQFEDNYPSNNFRETNGWYKPLNTSEYVAGCDPYDHSQTQDNRRSNGALYVKKKHTPGKEDDAFNNAYVIRYNFRPSNTGVLYEDFLKTCIYFGCELLVETQKPGVIKFFKDKGFEDFLIVLPGYKEPGIPSSQPNKQILAELTEKYIDDFIDKVYFIELCDDWLHFNINETQKYDDAMAFGWTEVADKYKIVPKSSGKLKDITEFFSLNKIA